MNRILKLFCQECWKMSREDIKHHGKLEREYEWENVVEGINHATETGHQVVILLEYD